MESMMNKLHVRVYVAREGDWNWVQGLIGNQNPQKITKFFDRIEAIFVFEFNWSSNSERVMNNLTGILDIEEVSEIQFRKEIKDV